MRWLVVILVLLVVLFLIGYFRIDGGVMLPGQTVLDSTVQWVQHAVGSTVAIVAALLLLIRAVQEERAEDVVPLVLPLFAGLALLHPDWPTILGLAVVAVGLFLRESLTERTGEADK
jgi:hypothetical protein